MEEKIGAIVMLELRLFLPDSLESQAVILLARADGAGEFCDATTRVNAGSIFPTCAEVKFPRRPVAGPPHRHLPPISTCLNVDCAFARTRRLNFKMMSFRFLGHPEFQGQSARNSVSQLRSRPTTCINTG